MIPIAVIKGDNADFIALVNRIVGRIVQRDRPRDVFLIRIDRSFDHKWRGFSGTILGVLGVRKKRLTIPPFVPGRVVSQESYVLDESPGKYRPVDFPPLHLRQPSRENLTRFIDRVSSAGLFVWFSGETQSATGCIMVYRCAGDSQSSWYVSFREAGTWQVYKSQGISKSEFLHLAEEAIHGGD